jgi:hypothetical protein
VSKFPEMHDKDVEGNRNTHCRSVMPAAGSFEADANVSKSLASLEYCDPLAWC